MKLSAPTAAPSARNFCRSPRAAAARAADVELARARSVFAERRLRQLPHAQGRGREGPGRAEPRRAEARRVDRRAAGARAAATACRPSAEAPRRADRAASRPSSPPSSRSSGTSSRLQARRHDARGAARRAASPSASGRPSGTSPTREGPEKALALLATDDSQIPAVARRLPPDLALRSAARASPTSRTTPAQALAHGSDDLQLGLLPRRPPARPRRRPPRDVVVRSRAALQRAGGARRRSSCSTSASTGSGTG